MEIFTEVISAACPHHLIRKAIAQETLVRFLGWEDPLEKEKATHSSNLAWKIPWTGETGKLQSMGRKESETSEATWHIHILFNGEVFSSAATLPA